MSQADREARLLRAVYRTYGVSASWTPATGAPVVTLTVRHDVSDDITPMGQGQALQRTNIIHVRVSEMPEAAKEDTVVSPRGTYRISRKPRLTDDGLEWFCEAVKV
ncbi:hypothetical protein D3C72_988120 [compost metagenome]